MDHETCSALLGPYARDELAGDDRRGVAAHLAGCADCTRELDAVTALMALPDAQLTADERRALHRVVLAPRRTGWARWAPALGAAGLAVTIAVGVAFFTQDADRPLQTAIQGEADTTELQEEGAEGGGGLRDRRANEVTAESKAAAQPPTTAAGTDDTDAGTTEAFSADSLAIVTTFSSVQLGPQLLAYDDAFGTPERILRRVARNADPAAGDQIRACAAVVREGYPFPLQPAFASVYQADGLLVMGFIVTSGTERRYAFWGWHLGDCTRPTPIYVTGPLL